MRTIDTNVFVRLVRSGHEEQTAAAARYAEAGAWVSTVALAEAVWVLATVYGRTAKELAAIVEMLLGNDRLVFQDAETVEEALLMFKAHLALGFTESLLVSLGKNVGHTPLGTFDRQLSRLPGAERI